MGFLLAGCGGGSAGGTTAPGFGTTPGDTTAPVPSSPADDPAGSALRLRWVSIRDPLANNLEAAKYLVPDGWTTRGGVVWNIGARFGGVTRDLAVISPDSLYGFEFYPAQPFTFSTGPNILPVGTFYSVAGAVIQPPMSAEEYLQRVVLPSLPYTNVTVLGGERLPGVAEALAASLYAPAQADAAHLRLRFDAGGTRFVGDLHAWIAYLQADGGPLGTVTDWTPERVFLVFAPEDDFEAAFPHLYPLAISEVPNPDWQQVPQIVENLRVQGIAAELELTRQLSEQLAANSAETFDLISEGFRQQQEANDRIFEAYDQTLRGVDTYVDPAVGAVELPSGFATVWSNPATGEYLLIDDVLFDPNADPAFAGNWNRIERRR